jgi:arylsulfatase
MERAVEEGKPFFLWHNSTRMHVWTILQQKYKDKSGYGMYADGMKELDDHVGVLLAKLDELGVADNTFVIFSTDNGAEKMTWPDGGNTPFRGEKGSTWEGGVRVPCLVRWPGVIQPGAQINDIFAHEDWMPTLVAAAGGPADLVERCRKGYKAGSKTFKCHLDGYDQRPLLSGKGPGSRDEFVYVLDSGELAAVRFREWKIVFSYQEGEGPWMWLSGKRFKPAWPYLFNLRSDPFEFATSSGLYVKWYGERMFAFVPAQGIVRRFAESFIEFPPSQSPGSLSIAAVKKQVLKKIEDSRKQGDTSIADELHRVAAQVDEMMQHMHSAHP